ncbi:MAG: hypothetical protein R3B45_10380 [Bdellovibrionota bacterium]
MSVSYEKSRINFDFIVSQYKQYLKLYAFFNDGSTEGATSFAKFYWVITYYSKYREVSEAISRGY